MRSGVRLAIVGLRSGLARRRDAALDIDTGDGRWGEQGGRDEGGEATGLRECPSSQKCMENDADHNVGRMKLDHAPAQVAPPWFLVTRAAVLRHGAICDNGGRGLEKKKNRCSLTAGLSLLGGELPNSAVDLASFRG